MEKSRKNKVKQKEDRIDSYRAAKLEAVVPKLSPDRDGREILLADSVFPIIMYLGLFPNCESWKVCLCDVGNLPAAVE